MYGTGSHPAQLSSYAHACGLMPRNLFLKCGILRALRMGHVKRTLALVFGLAAVLLFAPIARADFPGGKSPYRDLAPLSHAPGVTPADGGDEHGDDGAHDGSHAGDGRPGPLDPVGAFGHVPVAVASPDRHRGRGDLDGVRPPTAHESSVEPFLGGPALESIGRRAVRSFIESTPTERPASRTRKEK